MSAESINWENREEIDPKFSVKQSIHRAIRKNLLKDEDLASIQALRLMQQRDPGNPYIEDFIQKALSFMKSLDIRIQNDFSQDPDATTTSSHKELREDTVPQLNEDRNYRTFTLPAKMLSYLAEQNITIISLELGASSLADSGKMQSFLDNKDFREFERNLYNYENHWLGLYFKELPPLEEQKRPNPKAPLPTCYTTLNFTNANLRGASISLFYPSLSYQLRKRKDRFFNSFCLNFKSCWVKQLDFSFWFYTANFPGTLTVRFEDCEDFCEEDFPYLTREEDGNNYYFDLEKTINSSSTNNSSTETYVRKVLGNSESYKLEHLR